MPPLGYGDAGCAIRGRRHSLGEGVRKTTAGRQYIPALQARSALDRQGREPRTALPELIKKNYRRRAILHARYKKINPVNEEAGGHGLWTAGKRPAPQGCARTPGAPKKRAPGQAKQTGSAG